MPVNLSLKVLFWQVVLACVCAAGLLRVRVRAPEWARRYHSPESTATYRRDRCAGYSRPSICEDQQLREIRAHKPSKSGSTTSSQAPPRSKDTPQDELLLESGRKTPSKKPLDASSVPPEEIPGHHQHHAWLQAHKHGDLPLLPSDRSPDSDTWDNSVSICACMLQENTTDVREWLLYHRWLGVDHVYLTENSDPVPQQLAEQLQDFVDEGFLTLQGDGKKANQLNIYKRCMEEHRHEHNWMAFIDIDEFIVIRQEGMSLKQFLDGFKHAAGLVVHWVLMGSSGHERRPQQGGVLRHYHHCRTEPSDRVKTIANTWFLANHAGQVHNYEYRDNILAVDEYWRPMPPRFPLPEHCTSGSVPLPSADIHCRPVPDFRKHKDEPRSVDRIALYHYVLRSKADFEIKLERGGGDSYKRDEGYFNKIDGSAQHEGGVCEEPLLLADECCPESALMLT